LELRAVLPGTGADDEVGQHRRSLNPRRRADMCTLPHRLARILDDRVRTATSVTLRVAIGTGSKVVGDVGVGGHALFKAKGPAPGGVDGKCMLIAAGGLIRHGGLLSWVPGEHSSLSPAA